MNGKIKTILKTVCVIIAVLTLTLFSGCDLISSLTGGKDDNKKEDVVKVTPLNATIEVGETITLLATSSEGRAISWTSDDEEIATVDGGEVTGVAEGTAIITASDGKKMASCEITVIPAEDDDGNGEGDEKDPPSDTPKITLNSSAITIKEGNAFTLIARASDGSTVEWSSSNTKVATVLRGRVTGVSAGSAVITASSATAEAATCKVTVVPVPKEEYQLVWWDEFDGNSLDMTKWEYQTGVQDNYYGNMGPWCWGNDELQYYTNGANLKVSDGELQITAKREDMDNGRTFSSSRITTRDKYTVKYGIIEARMKTPAIEGMWPAFWMLPNPTNHSSTNNVYGGWPTNGELDIMEAKGRLVNKVDTTLHFGGPTWDVDHHMAGGSVTLSSSTEEWHTYGVEWTADYIVWLVDGKEYNKKSNSEYWSSASGDPSAPFNQPYYILLNLAVGGMYDSYRTPPADFKQATMYVDYVRVYQKTAV